MDSDESKQLMKEWDSATLETALEKVRRAEQIRLNEAATIRAKLEERYGQVWDTRQLTHDFEVIGFAAPYAVVRRKSDGRVGSLAFQHQPRLYFSWFEA